MSSVSSLAWRARRRHYKGGNVGLANGVMTGHVIALFCAFIWSAYSVLSRRFGRCRPMSSRDTVSSRRRLPSYHVTLETTVWPQTPTQWAAISILGAIPLGAGFYAWDYGCKHGDIMILGALSYAAPLFSVIVLLLAGFGVFHWSVALACILITVGAVVAANDLLLKQRPTSIDATPLPSSSALD
jgi:drug/metabolite transporter (DMT)-like permease